jgi:hypothetical protein
MAACEETDRVINMFDPARAQHNPP